MSHGTECIAGSNISSTSSTSVLSIRAKSRKNRVFVFREFLLETYGLEYLRQGMVLDVAGGKGDLSWLLVNIDQVTSVVADPRIPSCQHLLRSVEYLRTHPNEATQRAIPDCPSYQPLATLLDRLPAVPQKPRHLRILINQELVDALAQYKETGDLDEWDRFFEHAVKVGAQAKPLLGHNYNKSKQEEEEHEDSNATSLEISDSTEIKDSRIALDLLFKHVNLIVGFHPDQAVDACFDLAQLLNVPYCVVPCCVFPKQFPYRQLNGGERVRSYKELVEYLSQKMMIMPSSSFVTGTPAPVPCSSTTGTCTSTRRNGTKPQAMPCERALLDFYDISTARNIVLFSRPSLLLSLLEDKS